MDISHLYSIAAGSILIVFLSFKAFQAIGQSCTRNLQLWIFRNLVYPRLHLLLPVSYYELVLQLLYWGCTLATNVIRVTSLKQASHRAAQLSVANLAPLLLSSSLELTSFMLGVSDQTLRRIHGSIAAVTLLESTFHVATSVATHSSLSLRDMRTIYGLIAAVAGLLVVIVLLVRRLCYEVFLHAHLAFAIVAAVTLYKHTRTRISRLTLAGSAISFVLTVIFRFARMLYRSPIHILRPARNPTKQLSFAPSVPHYGPPALPKQFRYSVGKALFSQSDRDQEGNQDIIQALKARKVDQNLLRLQIQLPRPWKVRAGHYVQIRLPKLGFWSLLQAHTFMIAWWEETAQGTTIDLIIEKRQGFTHTLFEFTRRMVDSFPVLLDGPYGTPQILEEHGTILLFADDIGISAVLPYAKQLVQSRLDNNCIASQVVLIWRYTRPEYVATVQPLFNGLLRMDSRPTSKFDNDSTGATSKSLDHLLSIVQVDREAQWEARETYGQNQRAVHIKGDRTTQSLLASYLPNRPGAKVVAVAARKAAEEEVETYVFERNDKDLSFKKLGFKGMHSMQASLGGASKV